MRRSLLATLVAVSALLVACGDDDGDAGDAGGTVAATTAERAATADTATTDDTAASTPAAATAAVPASAVPATSTPPDASGPSAAGGVPRIVSISPVHTEILFAIGAGDQVVAVDSLSTYPPAAEAVLTDLSAYEPNVEAIAGYEPDLVVTSGDTGRDQLEALGIEVWVGLAPPTREAAYEQIEELGTVTGHAEEAGDLVASMEAEITTILDAAPAFETAPLVYHELDDSYFSADSTTFIGSIYADFGLQNVADRAEGDHGGYPQLSAEAIISADPDLIFLADTVCCATTAETVSARDGWQDITAVVDGNVVEMDDDVASRWGPRMVDYYRAVADALDVHVSGATVPSGT